MNDDPDWSLWRSFAAVVTHGSLSAAARALGLSQPTLGRHIEALEQALGIALFERSLGGLKPNDTALKLFQPVTAARTALATAAIMADGAQSAPDGTVRITASTVVSNFVLPGLLGPIRSCYPNIALEIAPSDAAGNLLLREADIAIRMFRPTQLELVTRWLGEVPMVPCAHQSYLERAGTPKTLAEFATHELIGFDRSDAILVHSQKLGIALKRDNFVLRTDDQTLIWALTTAGLGIGFAQANLVARTPGMMALDLDMAIPSLPVWLTTHKELFTSHRIRAIYDALADGLVSYIGGPTV